MHEARGGLWESNGAIPVPYWDCNYNMIEHYWRVYVCVCAREGERKRVKYFVRFTMILVYEDEVSRLCNLSNPAGQQLTMPP